MTDRYRITLEESPDPADTEALRQSLDAFNEAHVGPTNWRPFAVFVRDANSTIVGGLSGGTYWGWLYVEIFWLDERLRGQGYGSRLLAMAEHEAMERGCTYAHLDTMSFQALPFYERHGYSVFGVLDDMPAGSGQRRFWLKKTLQPIEQPTMSNG
ncbi:MAG TPA: GNAT family N-acetyltransferase [Herpetosiphonaceae bacterium]